MTRSKQTNYLLETTFTNAKSLKNLGFYFSILLIYLLLSSLLMPLSVLSFKFSGIFSFIFGLLYALLLLFLIAFVCVAIGYNSFSNYTLTKNLKLSLLSFRLPKFWNFISISLLVFTLFIIILSIFFFLILILSIIIKSSLLNLITFSLLWCLFYLMAIFILRLEVMGQLLTLENFGIQKSYNSVCKISKTTLITSLIILSGINFTIIIFLSVLIVIAPIIFFIILLPILFLMVAINFSYFQALGKLVMVLDEEVQKDRKATYNLTTKNK